MKYLLPLFIHILIVGCNNDSKTKETEENSSFNFDSQSKTANANGFLLDSTAYYVDSIIRQYIQTSIGTEPSEEYTYTFHKALLNKDKVTDAIISVNRLGFAKEKAKENGSERQAKKMAYMGPFNIFIFYDGRSNSFSTPIPVPSSPILPLDISFEHISSNQHKDLIVDFRIRNSSFKEVYFLFNNKPFKVFQWKNFDGLGETTEEAYTFTYRQSQRGNIKDIIVNKGTIETYPKEIDPFKYKPTIKNSKEVLKRFFYIREKGKYFSTKNSREQ